MRKIVSIGFLATFMWVFAGTSMASAATYVVQSGDCLWNISRSTGLSVETIKQLNGLSSDRLSIGQILNLGVDSAPAEVQAPVTESSVYIVNSGDSLWAIAVRLGTSVQTIRDLNGMTNDLIHVGDQLIIPGPNDYLSVSRSGESVSGSRIIEKAA
jgi:D-gamma-glutamyl-meso-diaminopimelic acid endopeptidase CwlS